MDINANILIVDDEIKVINALCRVFNNQKYNLLSITTPEEALNIIDNNKIDVIICDYNMPNISGIEVLKYAKKVLPDTVRILITGYGDLDMAISAINEGSIFYYFSKPWKNQEILEVVEKALEDKFQQKTKGLMYEALNNSQEHLDQIANKMNSFRNILESQKPFQKHKKEDNHVKRIPVREDENIVLINPSEIIYLMAESGNVIVMTQKGRYKSSDSLNSWQDRLDETHFFRCHRSYIINIGTIEKIIPWFNSAYNIQLKDKKEYIPVSRSAMKRLRELFEF